MTHKHHTVLLFFLTFALATLAFIAVVRQVRFTASLVSATPVTAASVS
ncbi:MAG: hypothetical protein ABIG34_01770 [Candidatus Peregrinibacteria bacterium]